MNRNGKSHPDSKAHKLIARLISFGFAMQLKEAHNAKAQTQTIFVHLYVHTYIHLFLVKLNECVLIYVSIHTALRQDQSVVERAR